ncbi:hypothetical protein ACN99C_26955 (plasmid) [Pseudomonas alloputida]|uniref:hypothetical protein n=1 Tax=Pseudomonas alloputida TaxID=1940621 RepID=UPI003B431A9C
MKLSALAVIRTNFPDAHFWLVRRSSMERCGEPVRVFNPEHIGIKITRTDVLLPDYLFYVFLHIHQIGHWQKMATGTLQLVNIRIADVRNIELTPR